jgi:thymidylate kinase
VPGHSSGPRAVLGQGGGREACFSGVQGMDIPGACVDGADASAAVDKRASGARAVDVPGASALRADKRTAEAAAADGPGPSADDADASAVVDKWAELYKDFPVPSPSNGPARRRVPDPVAPVYRVCLTGGPCSGKTSSVAEISDRLRSRGFGVYVVPEAATLLFTGGCSFVDQTPEQVSTFQASLLRTQMALEDNFYRIATAASRPSVLLCDRGAMDGRAYMSAEQWEAMLAENSWDPVALRDERYDLVVHMVTAADGAMPFYQLENNKTRRETPSEARAVDRETQEAWVGHPQLRIVDNRTGFREKINRVFTAIGELLGVHVSKRPVRKFLVAKDVRPRALESCVANLEEFEVEQTFLQRGRHDGVQESVRRRGGGGSFTFVHKVRRPAVNGQIRETKRQISNRAYVSLLANADPERRAVRIKRQCFVKSSQYFVLDTVLNVAPPVRLIRAQVDDDATLELPRWIRTEREVTGDPDWCMYAMSSRIVPERVTWPFGPDRATQGGGIGPAARDVDIASSF